MFDNVLVSDMPALVDVAPSTWTTIVRALVLSHEIPLVRYSAAGQNANLAQIDDIVRNFQDPRDHQDQSGRNRNRRNLLLNFSQQYYFTVGPDAEIPFKSLNGLAQEFGWEKIGIVVEKARSDNVDTRIVYSENNELR